MQNNAHSVADGHATEPAGIQWACLGCGPAGFAVPLERISEIVTPQPFTRVPGCGPEVCGLVGLRGRVLTVFDLGVLGGAGPAVAAKDYRMAFLEHRGRLLGLAAESMVTVARAHPVPDVPVETPGLLLPGDVTGTVAAEGRTFTALDVDHLLGRLLV